MGKTLTNEEFLQKLKDNNVLYIPLEEYKGASDKIKFQCYKNSNHVFEMKPKHIYDGHGCPYCYGRKTFVGETDLWTTHPEIAKFLLNPEDGYKYSFGSQKKVDWICPDCGNSLGEKIIKNVVKEGLSCPICSDGSSYSEKFMSELLNQLNINYLYDRTFDWSNRKRYDFYLPDYNIIIETHGEQHYIEKIKPRRRTLQEEFENDEYKRKLAIDNGIEIYIVIDCSKTNFDFIKNSIINSEMNDIFDLTNVNWIKCHASTMTSNTRLICDLWNSGMKNSIDISKHIGMDKSTVINKLKFGAEIGLCDYVPYLYGKYSNVKKTEICVEI